MARTDLLRRQHEAAARLAANLRRLTLAYRGKGDAMRIASELARLLGLLRIHLAQEDLSLYPAMLRSSDPAAAALAHRFQAEMGGLAASVEQFMLRWASSTMIALGIDEFRDDLDTLLNALTQRIDRENHELYPLADAMPVRDVA